MTKKSPDVPPTAEGSTEREDVVLVGPEVEGEGPKRHTVLRYRREAGEDGQLELGEIREAEEGKPILGELVRLRARGEGGRLFDVDVQARGPLASRSGPPMVASDAFRDGWERTFAKKPTLAN